LNKQNIDQLEKYFGKRLQRDVPLGRYTTARVGGNAEGLVEIKSAYDLADAVLFLWQERIPCKVIGGGSNVLISDEGYNGIVILNKATQTNLDLNEISAVVYAESGANLGSLARRVSLDGYTGLEWAAGIPGTVGGAVYGNAGAHGADMASNLDEVEILLPDGRLAHWTANEMEYAYRSSILKREFNSAVILSVGLKLDRGDRDEIKARLEEYAAARKKNQPTGASLGSIFKNPAGEYAGRLIEAAGLKGTRVGGVEISRKHANFFINDQNATAQDLYDLIRLARKTVWEKFGVSLETEIEILGSFKDGGK
jgi:UDP-N-acetylmuramate dehydrogenase